jgi:predicted adenylyl cyclase CyaB
MFLSNIEIKAKLRNYGKIKKTVEALCSKPTDVVRQKDTFFYTKSGRLKLRETPNNSALIYYDRKDSVNPTLSEIQIHSVENTDSLKTILTQSIGIRGIVKKKRRLYHYDQTRIHLDDVESLGKFIELEVLLEKEQSFSSGVAVAKDLMKKFDIDKNDLIDVAYIDLIEENE